ncbi:Variant-specific surface protein [Giardia duodenalis]|uniref:Variant-specific surface protein n=1 Tax=Giardia intestinalis TaxID=5741 RepID=V6TTX2_GIAIN|nr:Variant-specific surface protein [Giardia intestinalis]
MLVRLPRKVYFYITSNLNRILMLLAIYFAIGVLAADCTGGAAENQCTSGKCESVGDAQICTSCVAGNVPINGKCVAKDGVKTKCTTAASDGTEASDQTCKKCLLETFMYQGGCYETTAAPGKAMCTKAAAGLCTAAAVGYFVPTGAVNTEQSVVACDDTTGVTIAAISGKYKGVQNCMTCVTSDAAPGARADTVATCTRCKDQQYLKENACVADASQCTTGYAAKKDDTNGNKCLACTDQSNGGAANCAECSYDSANTRLKCTKCDADKYLKTAADGTTTCETTCPEGYFGHTATGGLKTCQSCATEATLDPAVTGIPGCTQCTYADSTLKCTACGSGYKLEGEACVPAGTNLSTGAIAGISVAAVVVVGGLVGFLCWWFICRGKA